MGELLPTYDSVFSPDYWSPVTQPIDSRSKFEIIKTIDIAKANGFTRASLSPDVRAQLENLFCNATYNLLNGQEVDRVGDNELIGSPDDKRYAIPGNVLLIDKEELFVSSGWRVTRQDQDTTFCHEIELGMPTIPLFVNRYSEYKYRSALTPRIISSPFIRKLISSIGIDMPNDKNMPNYTGSLTPFSKHISVKGIGRYSRSINLFAFAPNKKGQLVGVGMSEFIYDPDNAVAMSFTDQLLPERFYPIGRVGETKDLSASPQLGEYSRIKEAYICLRGSLEYAKVKKDPAYISQKRRVPALVALA